MKGFIRKCVQCGTTSCTNNRGWQTWRLIYAKNGKVKKVYCKNCWRTLFDNPKYNPIYQPMRIVFKDKRLSIGKNPRKGRCSLCGKKIGDTFINKFGRPDIIKQTHMHHTAYHPEDPLKDAVEVCASCHMKESRRLKQIVHIPTSSVR